MPTAKPPIARDWFTVLEAARLSGLSRHMVQYLNRVDLVKPTYPFTGAARKGVRSKYTFADLVTLRAVAHFLKQGVLVSRLKRALTVLRARYPEIRLESVPGRYLVLGGGRELYFEDRNSTIERLSDGQLVFAFVLEFQQIRDEVKSRLSKQQFEIASMWESRQAA